MPAITESDEDAALLEILKSREKYKGKFVSHEKAWAAFGEERALVAVEVYKKERQAEKLKKLKGSLTDLMK